MGGQNVLGSEYENVLGLTIPNTAEILTLSSDELLARLKTSLSGLSSEEVERRLKVFGYNELARKKKRAAILDFLYHFKNPLVIILLIAGLISGFYGELPNAFIIFSIVLFSTILDFYQERKAENAAEMLKKRVATTATVLRDGVKREVGFPEIVPGDIIFLSAGDVVPADARVISAKDLFVDQSALTGESVPVEKTPEPLKSADAPIMEWTNYLFMGTSVVSGTATALVVKTGNYTEYGKIAKTLVTREVETEFQRGLQRFGYLIMQVTFLLVIFVFFVNALYMHNVLVSLLFSVALAVGLTPELLPMIVSINLSKGAVAMSRKGVIVKRLASIQNFGNMDILCTDKTGTLTENKIKLLLHVDCYGNEDEKVLLFSYLNSYYQTGLRSPLDDAILEYREIEVKEYRKVDEVPFDFVRKRLSVVVKQGNQVIMITKGAPEEIFKICSKIEVKGSIFELSEEFLLKVQKKYIELSSEGFRILGVAYKLLEDKPTYTVSDESGMVFLGFVAFLDPPKETASTSLKLLSDAGVEVKILTGDNELVTRKVCERIGFEIKGVVLGNEIAQMNDDALARVVEEANVFCRVTPAQKNRIINALKNNGHVVGFLGDGINDAPSIKSADVGLSVDNAVDVAKEAADIILLKNDLTILHDGVLEGRKAFGNTMKYIMMGTSSNFGNMFSVAGASLFLPFLPMLPIQILLNNLLYDLAQSVIPADNVDHEYIEKPKRLNISFIRRFMIIFGPISSIFDFLTFFIMLFVFKANESLFQTAWFIESLSTQTLVVFSIRTRKSPFYKSRPSKILALSSMVIILFALLLPMTPLGAVFKFTDLPTVFYIVLLILIGTYITLVEAVKTWFYKRYSYILEQALIPPKRIGIYLSKSMRLVQNIIAIICLRYESEITIDSLVEELETAMNYPVELEQLYHKLQHLRKAGLITINWPERKIKREKPLKEYVIKNMSSEVWPKILDDWQRLKTLIQAKYGKINPEYEKLLAQNL